MKLSFRQMWAEFKDFAFKGSLLDLAVAVVLGAAFGKVITSLVDDIIMPSVTYAVDAVKATADAAKDTVKHASEVVGATSKPSTQPTTGPVVAVVPAPTPAPAPEIKKVDKTEAVKFDLMVGRLNIGHFIGALLNFIIVAFAVFIVVVKGIGGAMKKVSGPVVPGEPTTKECPKCLSVIPIKATKCSHCTADLV